MDVRQSLFSFGMIAISAFAAYFLFRKNPREQLITRGPVFIVCFLLFFYIGVLNLPLALPELFRRVIGHSVWEKYLPPPKLNVIQEGGTWWVVRWLDPIRTAYFCVVLGGIVWAVVNLVRGRSWKWNAACLAIAAVGFVLTLYLSVACFPFCF